MRNILLLAVFAINFSNILFGIDDEWWYELSDSTEIKRDTFSQDDTLFLSHAESLDLTDDDQDEDLFLCEENEPSNLLSLLKERSSLLQEDALENDNQCDAIQSKTSSEQVSINCSAKESGEVDSKIRGSCKTELSDVDEPLLVVDKIKKEIFDVSLQEIGNILDAIPPCEKEKAEVSNTDISNAGEPALEGAIDVTESQDQVAVKELADKESKSNEVEKDSDMLIQKNNCQNEVNDASESISYDLLHDEMCLDRIYDPYVYEPLIYVAKDFLQLHLDLFTWFNDSVFIDCCQPNVKTPLMNFLYAEDIRIQDIFLAAKLSLQGLITLPGVEGISPLPFGAIATEQYIACSANTKVLLDGYQKETGAALSCIYQFIFNESRLKVILALVLPVKHREHYLNLCFSDGFIFCTHPTNFLGENNLTQFFGDYTSFEDYFKREVLDPKKLTYKPIQHETGLGDLSLIFGLDFTDFLQAKPSLEVGARIVVPTGKKTKERYLFEIELGNGGAYQIIPYTDVRFYTGAPYLNPRLYCEAIISLAFTGIRRVPLRKNNSSCLLLPSRYQSHVIAPFSEFDTIIRGFADSPVATRIRYATELHMQISNYWYKMLESCFSLGVFYDLNYKKKDFIEVDCCCEDRSQYNELLLQDITKLEQHSISWNLWWEHSDGALFEIGSTHVLRGTGAPVRHSLFVGINVSY